MATTAQETYYDVLGVSQSASIEEINTAWKKLIQQWHPDHCQHPNATVKSQQINEAHQALKDPSSRRQYDSELREARESHRTYEDATAHFRQESSYGQAAAARAQDMTDWDIDQTLREAAATLWKGSQSYRREEAGCGSSMGVGCSAWILVLSLVFPPGAIVLYFVIRGTFFPNGRFVGIGTILGGMLVWLGIGVAGSLIVVSGLNSMAASSSESSGSYRQDYSMPEQPVMKEEPIRISIEEANAGLLKAADDGDEYEIKRYVIEGADLSAKGEQGMTALHLAVAGKHDLAVDSLLSLGADVNAQDDDGLTPLHIAVQSSNVRITANLLEGGANVDARDRFSVTPLIIASKYWTYADISNLEAERNERLNRNIFVAMNSVREEQMRLLLNHGAAIDAVNEAGISSLILCCMKGFVLGANLLLGKGADITLRTTNGESAHDIAVRLDLSIDLIARLQPPPDVLPPIDDSGAGDGQGQSPPVIGGGGG